MEAVATASADNSALLTAITAVSVMALVGGTALFIYLNTGTLPFPTFPPK